MDEGYIKLFRRMTAWEWYTDTAVKTLFVHCILRANYTDKSWKGMTIKRGQFVTSIRNLAKECGLSIKQTRRAISALTRTHEIEYKGHNKFSVITVVEYDSYQSKGTVEGTKEGKQRANKGQQLKNIKNNKEYKEEKEVCPYVDENGYITDWDNFRKWKAQHPDWKGDDE